MGRALASSTQLQDGLRRSGMAVPIGWDDADGSDTTAKRPVDPATLQDWIGDGGELGILNGLSRYKP